MELLERKKAFYRTLVVNGIGQPGHLKRALPLGSDVPQEKLETWLCRFTKVKDMDFPEVIRNVNRFKLGADPEFVFATNTPEPDMDEGGRGDASRLGLKQGLAFGADNNGRLAEIRPYPSRSALETCASVFSTLKWLAIMHPNTMRYRWLSGAFIFRDGVGGHVHFGRKRPNRELEVRALDVLSEMLLAFDVYPRSEMVNRRRGDSRGQRYGMPGDFRLQTHGYEYRTFPSWLDSPELAFMTLTLSKLTVQDPSLVLQFDPALPPDRKWQQLQNFIAYYKGVDDDARIALLMLQRNSMPRHLGGDFKARWGITQAGLDQVRDRPQYIPPSIPPTQADKRALFELFTKGRTLSWTVPTPTWKPVKLAKGYVPVLSYIETNGAKGFGELLAKMCVRAGNETQFVASRDGSHVMVGRHLSRTLKRNWNRGIEDLFVETGDHAAIAIPQSVRESSQARRVKDILTSGIFPIWHVEKVQEDSYEKWQESVTTQVVVEKKARMRSKVLVDEVIAPEPKKAEPFSIDVRSTPTYVLEEDFELPEFEP